MTSETFIAMDGKHLECTLWDDVRRPIGVVQIIHGMDEHVGRYDRFAKFLNKHGYIVFGDDHRAHGRTARSVSKIGQTDGSRNLFMDTVADEMEIYEYLRGRFNLPVFIFGHSYGSFITQRLIHTYNFCAAGVCLSGTARYPRTIAAIGAVMAWIGKTLFGADAPARFLELFSPIRGEKNGQSKLTRDAHQVALHNADPMRAKYFSYGFYYSLFSNMLHLGMPSCKTMPVMIIGGSQDAVSMNGRFARRLWRIYRNGGMQDIAITIYPDARHELLMETNYDEVQQDILIFLKYARQKWLD